MYVSSMKTDELSNGPFGGVEIIPTTVKMKIKFIKKGPKRSQKVPKGPKGPKRSQKVPKGPRRSQKVPEGPRRS